MPFWSLALFLVSALFMIFGITLFNLGVDVSLIPIGEQIGSSLVKSRNLLLIIVSTFMIGIFISVAEPDLIVLAEQINGVPDSMIILVVSLGVGLALVLGVFINYFGAPKGDPVILFLGVALIVVAIVLNGIASGKTSLGKEESRTKKKGVVIAVCAGLLMSFFYRFVASTMDLNNLENPTEGMLTPYGAFFIFSLGILGSNFLFNTVVMKRPFVGEPVYYSQYFRGSFNSHWVGILGGIIWGVGTAFSYIAAGKAGPAISYALGQGAPMIAALWGVFIWKEFKGSPKTVNYMLAFMFAMFITGLSLIVASGGN